MPVTGREAALEKKSLPSARRKLRARIYVSQTGENTFLFQSSMSSSSLSGDLDRDSWSIGDPGEIGGDI